MVPYEYEGTVDITLLHGYRKIQPKTGCIEPAQPAVLLSPPPKVSEIGETQNSRAENLLTLKLTQDIVWITLLSYGVSTTYHLLYYINVYLYEIIA